MPLIWLRRLIFGAVATAITGAAAPTERVRAAGWSTRAPLPEARQEVAVAALDGRVYVIGGFRGDVSISAAVDVYDPTSNAWSPAALLPTPVHHAAAATAGGKLYVFGGWPDFFVTPLDTVYEYDPAMDDWIAKAPMPSARAGLAVANVGGKIYAAGGLPSARENDFAVYDPVLDDWTDLSATAPMPTARNHLAAGAVAGRFYAVGGRSGSGTGGITAALEEFDPATGLWSARPAMPTARGGIAAAVFGSHLIVFGGEGNPNDPNGVFAEVEAYDAVAGTWRTLTPMPTPRHGIGAAQVSGLIHVPSGGPVEGFGVTDVHEVYDPASDLPVLVPALSSWGALLLVALLLAAALAARQPGRGRSRPKRSTGTLGCGSSTCSPSAEFGPNRGKY
jgi:N-acetylneuraminic acid mutarotase